MTRALVFKLLRDVRLYLAVLMAILFAFQLLWAKVTFRLVGEMIAQLNRLGVDITALRGMLFQESGKLMQTLMGGESISIERAIDMMSIAYVHPITQLILCIWAVGRSASAISGELDRGTMELLLAQPIRRSQVIVAHFVVDLCTIPFLAAAMILGTFTGVHAFGLVGNEDAGLNIDAFRFVRAALPVMALVFSVSGMTMAVSAFGRQRGKTLGVAVLIVLMMFLVNVIGQLWPPLEPLRPATVFYYYQPQPMVLRDDALTSGVTWLRLGVLIAVGLGGYALAAWHFCRRDLPAPL